MRIGDMSWKPEVMVEGKWAKNDLVFATEKEAKDNAMDLMFRWTKVQKCRAVESELPANYVWVGDKLERIVSNVKTG
jgi:hypothetical protein